MPGQSYGISYSYRQKRISVEYLPKLSAGCLGLEYLMQNIIQAQSKSYLPSHIRYVFTSGNPKYGIYCTKSALSTFGMVCSKYSVFYNTHTHTHPSSNNRELRNTNSLKCRHTQLPSCHHQRCCPVHLLSVPRSIIRTLFVPIPSFTQDSRRT